MSPTASLKSANVEYGWAKSAARSVKVYQIQIVISFFIRSHFGWIQFVYSILQFPEHILYSAANLVGEGESEMFRIRY